MLDRALERSRIVRFLESLPERTTAAVEASGLRRLGGAISQWVQASYCYRWLTAEPDPDVIVIDLRETYTVGPIIRILEWVGDRLADGYANSRTEPAVSRVGTTVQAQPIRALGAMGLVCVPVSLLALTLFGALSVALFAGHLVTAVLSAAALRSTRSLAELRESRPISLLVAALEPPEPPESHRGPAENEPDETATRPGEAAGDEALDREN